MKVDSQLTGRGKLGNVVYSQNGGVTITRAYKASIANPNSDEQVSQRARFKLMAQLAAAFAPVIVIPKDGLRSPRNQFVQKNFAATSANDGKSQITFENLQLTSGTAGLPAIMVDSTTNPGYLTCKLADSASMACDRVCYILFAKTAELQLQYVTSIIVTTAGADGRFTAQLPVVSGDAVIYAYGMKDLNSQASARYGNYNVQSAADIASLVLSRKISMSDYRFTQTRGTQLLAGQTSNVVPDGDEAQVWAGESGPITVTGAGIYPKGTEVQLQATPAEGTTFIGWRLNGTEQFIGYSPTLRVVLQDNLDVIAVAYDPNSQTGGEPGAPTQNPLPYAYAEVLMDEETVDIQSGFVPMDETFDSLEINNIGDDHDVVYVPAGSYLGADDNVMLEPDPMADADYFMDVTGSGPGTIYLDGQVFFYIGGGPWVNPYPGASIRINEDPLMRIEQVVKTNRFRFSNINLYDMPDGLTIKAKFIDGQSYEIDFSSEGVGMYEADFLDQEIPVDIYVNGSKWITVQPWNNPYPSASILVDDSAIIYQRENPFGEGLYNIEILGMVQDATLTIRWISSGEIAYTASNEGDGDYVFNEADIDENFGIYVNDALWLTFMVD